MGEHAPELRLHAVPRGPRDRVLRQDAQVPQGGDQNRRSYLRHVELEESRRLPARAHALRLCRRPFLRRPSPVHRARMATSLEVRERQSRPPGGLGLRGRRAPSPSRQAVHDHGVQLLRARAVPRRRRNDARRAGRAAGVRRNLALRVEPLEGRRSRAAANRVLRRRARSAAARHRASGACPLHAPRHEAARMDVRGEGSGRHGAIELRLRAARRCRRDVVRMVCAVRHLDERRQAFVCGCGRVYESKFYEARRFCRSCL